MAPRSSRSGALLPCLPFPSYFRLPQFPIYQVLLLPPPPRIPSVRLPSTPPIAPPRSNPLGATRGGFLALSTQLCLNLVPPHHEPFGCFKDPIVPFPLLFRCSGPQRSLNSKHRGGVFRLPFGDSDSPKVFDYASMPSLELSARSRVFPASHRPDHYPTG